MLSLQSLRTPPTATQVLDFLVGLLRSAGFSTTGWQSGRIQLSLLKLPATLASDFAEAVKLTAELGFNETAFGAALTEYSRSRYGNERQRAVATEGPMRLRNTAQIPYTVTPGELIAATDSGIEFRNTSGGTIPAGSSASPSITTLQWKAAIAGNQGNVELGSVTRLLTPLAGVTIANDASDPWYSKAGVDEESDEALERRNATKWARLSIELTRDAYENIAREAGARKVAVDDNNPRGAGTIDVYVASDAALLSTDELAAIQNKFAACALQTDEYPASPTSRVMVAHPYRRELDVVATVYHRAGVAADTIRARCLTALSDYVALTPLGGWDYGPGLANVIPAGDLYNVLKEVEDVLTVTLTTPASTVPVGTLDLVTLGTINITPVEVAS